MSVFLLIPRETLSFSRKIAFSFVNRRLFETKSDVLKSMISES